jgi:hypothetical protein
MSHVGKCLDWHRCNVCGTRPTRFSTAVLLVGIVSASWGFPTIAVAQVAAPIAAAPATLPEPIYWKQHLFLIPYQWNSAAEPAAALLVTLYVSKDRGASWQKISDAKPQVKAFNYRAEGDGEFWFAVRTLDNYGRSTPTGPCQPELRVIVDTIIPRFDELRARPTETGAIDIFCRATDINLDLASLKVESSSGPTGLWQPVTLQGIRVDGQGSTIAPGFGLHALWQPPAGVRPLAIRATISDRASNSAVYQTPVETTPTVAGPLLSQPAAGPSVPPLATPGLPAAPAPGWTSGAAAATPSTVAPLTQPWPAGAVARAPFRLWTSGNPHADDGVTAYGNPPQTISTATPSVGSVPFNVNGAESQADRRVPAHFADVVKSPDNSLTTPTATTPVGPQFAPLEPFRQASVTSQPALAAGPSLVPLGQLSSPSANQSPAPIDTPPSANRPEIQPKLVGSRTFALEYELDDTGHAGVSRVELWGTRDRGHTWNRYAVDNDNRSPLIVTVDDEGLYGFKILVQAAAGAAIVPPREGDEPELWVSVDLQRPIIELTAIERGEGNLADHLILHWRAQDNNLEPRPISLYFSSQPTGPWSAIATNLEDTGQYAWRVERYVPTRIYLRIEARDVAGNMAAFQTREPVEFTATQTTGHLRPAPPAGPTASGGYAPYR